MTPVFLSKKNSGTELTGKPIFSRSSRKKESLVVIGSRVGAGRELMKSSSGGVSIDRSVAGSMKNLNPMLYTKINEYKIGGQSMKLRPGMRGSSSMSNEFMNSR